MYYYYACLLGQAGPDYGLIICMFNSKLDIFQRYHKYLERETVSTSQVVSMSLVGLVLFVLLAVLLPTQNAFFQTLFAKPQTHAATLCGNQPSGQVMPVGDLQGWRQVATDDFEGSALNKNIWGDPYTQQPGGDPAGWWDPNHVIVSNCMLNLHGSMDPVKPGIFVTGGVAMNYGQTYGKYLVRMRADKGNGISAIALLWPVANVWPPEVDFFEDGGGNRIGTSATLHCGPNGDDSCQVQKLLDTYDFSQWHTVGVEWTPGKLVYTIDDTVWATVERSDVPSIPMTLDLQSQSLQCSQWNTCVDGSTPDSVDMQIDWVSVYAQDSSAVGPTNPTPTANPTSTPTETPMPTATPAPIPTATPIAQNTWRIDTGTAIGYTDPAGQIWQADTNYTDSNSAGIVDRGAVSVANTSNPQLYRTEHWGMNSYHLPVANGTYTVTLHFAETNPGFEAAGKRMFDYAVNGTKVSNFDVFAAAGGFLRAVDRTSTVNVTNGAVDLIFTPHVDSTEINGIEVLPGVVATPTPSITAQPTGTPLPTARPTATPTPVPTGTPAPTSVVASGWLEAELMHWSRGANVGLFSDAQASAGKALVLYSNETVSGNVNGAGSVITVRAKEDYCLDHAHMVVTVDGTIVMATTLYSGNWTNYLAGVNLASGTHAVSVSFDNDYYSQTTCDRNLRLDKISLN
jgi:hypothetical protein